MESITKQAQAFRNGLNQKSLANCKAFSSFVIPLGLFSNHFVHSLKAIAGL